ncbi:DUF1287 domain-containing protein, partial [Pseudomonas aeruginosa]|uniref:DUF1287 domain-containing protein n=1 Tax=Pseudomonas aeruginosa TaxID=287 RepID=UPI003F718A69
HCPPPPNIGGITPPPPTPPPPRHPTLSPGPPPRAGPGPPSRDASAYRAGDIVAWRLDNGLLHIGVLSDRRLEGRPLVLHNIGAGVREEDLLFRYQVIGHYRFPQG